MYRSWYLNERPGPIYPEVTAYAVSLSCILFNETRDKRLLERAERCATYLINMSREGEVTDPSNAFAYTFDTGIFVSSMFDLYKATGKEIYIDQAERSLRWLLIYWNGKTFFDRVSIKNGAIDPSSYINLAKLSIPLIKASYFLKDQKYADVAIELLRWAEGLQSSDGRFSLSEAENKTMLHYHCYAIEGFLYAYHGLKNERYLQIAKKAAEWLSKIQNEDGSFYQWYPRPSTHISKNMIRHLLIGLGYRVKVTDATAQAARIWKILGINDNAIEKAYHYLNGELEDGGLRLFRRKLIFEYSDARVYSWPTFFYIHSLLITFRGIGKIGEVF